MDIQVDQIQRIDPFSYHWPDGGETFSPAWEAQVRIDGRASRVRHGLAARKVYGAERAHSVTFLDSEPIVEGVASDDYATSRALLSLLKVGRSDIPAGSTPPDGYEEFEVVRHDQELKVPGSRRGLAVKITEDDVETWAKHAALRRAAKQLAPTESPLHILLKWRATEEPRTIDLHREIADQRGSVWWGKFGQPSKNGIGPQKLARIRAQLQSGAQTHVYLYRAGEVWRTTLEEVTVDPAEVDRERLPSYYSSSDCNLFVRLSEFKTLPAGWPVEHLVLESNRDPTKLPGALNNQANPLFVLETSTSDAEPADVSVQELLEALLAGFGQARTEPLAKHPLVAVMRKLERALESTSPVRGRPFLKVWGSPGQGVWAKVPWVVLADKRETDTTQDGVYCVFLFRQDMSGVYLTLNQGVIVPRRARGGPDGDAFLHNRALMLRDLNPQLANAGFSLDDEIDLRADSGLGAHYEISTAAYIFYAAGAVPDDAALERDLEAVLSAYDRYLKETPRPSPSPQVELGKAIAAELDLEKVAKEFGEALHNSHIDFGVGHDQLVRSFVASLATKRFVILTGLSGSGKTQIALRFGDWLGPGRHLLEPVRPDWTGAEALFGYEDALEPPDESGSRRWSVPRVLAFILEAAANPQEPYLLILDEMNLAHVERYFADVLSGMESDDPVLPNLSGATGDWRMTPGAVKRIPFPRNLFVVGTVNVDETTYMFSPKVLDRANVFEFRVESGDLGLNYRRPIAAAPGSPGLVRGFLEIASDDQWQAENPAPSVEQIASRLRIVHGLLAPAGFEFAHRVFYEATRFASMLSAAGGTDPDSTLDLVMMQKILPRLHGSRRRVEGVLSSLAHFALDYTVDVGAEPGQLFDPLGETSAVAVLPMTLNKVRRMTERLRANQFVSFTD